MANEKQEEQESTRVTFHFIKGNHFHVVHADGVFGGVTPRGLLNLNFYSERGPIPRATTFPLDKEGRLGEEIREERVARDGVVREMEVGVMLDTKVAKSLVDWLMTRIIEAERLIAQNEAAFPARPEAKK